jgi:hypothetical protein
MQDRCAVRGTPRGPGLEPMLEDGGNALVVERTDLDRAGTDSLSAGCINATEQTQDAETGAEPITKRGQGAADSGAVCPSAHGGAFGKTLAPVL